MIQKKYLKLIIFIFLFIPKILQAEIMVGESIEWLVDTSNAIAQYKVIDATIEMKGETWAYLQINGVLTNKLKGKAPNKISFTYYSQGTSDKSPGIIQNGTKFIVFINTEKNTEYVIRYNINLDKPNTRGFRSIAFTEEFEVLKNKKDIIAAVKNRIKLNRNISIPSPEKAANINTRPEGFLLVEIPYDTEAFKALYSKSSCYLVVPAPLNIWISSNKTVYKTSEPILIKLTIRNISNDKLTIYTRYLIAPDYMLSEGVLHILNSQGKRINCGVKYEPSAPDVSEYLVLMPGEEKEYMYNIYDYSAKLDPDTYTITYFYYGSDYYYETGVMKKVDFPFRGKIKSNSLFITIKK